MHTHLPPTLRPATEGDLPAVLALYAQPGMYDGQVLTLEEARTIFAQFGRHPDYTLYVAEQDGAVVGSFALLVMPNLAHRGAPSAVVEDVVVAPSAQSRGIGRSMMAFALAEAGRKGCYKLALSSNLRRTRAHRFYAGLGFRQHGWSFLVEPPAP